jgi:hypothetical protein
MIHGIGLEFDEEHNGEFRFQISSFLKTLWHVSHFPLESNMATYKIELVNAAVTCTVSQSALTHTV